MDVFAFVCLLRGINGDGPDGRVLDAAALNAAAKSDPEWGREHRSFLEHVWRTAGRETTEQWIECLVAAARYLSDLIGGEVPITAPREVVEASIGICRPADQDTLLIGKAFQRAVAGQVNRQAQFNHELIIEEIRSLRANSAAIPAGSQWLTTKDIANRLQISEATAERKCRCREIDAEKMGGKWRTTAGRLSKSPFVVGNKRRRGGGDGAVE